MFTDVEGSTRLWASDAAAMSASLEFHDDVLDETIRRHGGYVFTTAGDAFCVAFSDVTSAIDCARSIHDALSRAPWPGPALRVRIGIHRGESEQRNSDYFGPTVNTAARVASAGHGGQTILTDAVRAAAGPTVVDLGAQRLRDVPEPIHLFQDGDGAFPRLRVLPDAMSSLPIPSTALVGREESIRIARSQLLHHRLVTVTGVGGSGKTRFALEVAERELAQLEHGAYFADLSSVSDEGGVARSIADAVRLGVAGGDPTSQILDYLADKDALVVLDNCEHVIDECAIFADAMLSRRGRWRMIATSREFLDVDGEHIVQLPALESSIDGPAVELFIDRASSVDPDFQPDAATRSTIATLCEHLDGIPLAIELAASRVTVMTPHEMMERIHDRFRLLSGGRRRARHRQSTLEAALDWSYELLSDEEGSFFTALGVTAGPFDLALASTVSGVAPAESLELLDSLVAKSLVVIAREGTRTRFRFLETVREYALGHLRRVPNGLETTRDLHLSHHLTTLGATVEAAEARYGSWVVWEWSTVTQWLSVIQNLEVAIDWAIACDRHADAAELLVGATPLWREQFAVQPILDRIELVAASLPTGSELRERLLIPQVQLAMVVNDLRGWKAFESASQQARDATVREFRLVMAANSCSMTAPARSLEIETEAAEYGNDAFHFWDKNRADVYLFAGEYEQAVAALRAHQGQNLWAVIDGTIAVALLMAGQADEALRVAKDHPMRESIRMSYGVIVGLCHLALGEIDDGRREILNEARSAALGRMNLVANSALVGMAALVQADGQTDWAREIILGARCQREVAINALARDVADQLGVRDSFVAQQVEALSDMTANDRTEFLRSTLARYESSSASR